jgi:hypothetical protein
MGAGQLDLLAPLGLYKNFQMQNLFSLIETQKKMLI